MPKFRPLFSKRFARRKEGEKNPTPGAPQTCPKERAFYAFRFFPLLFFFQTEARFFFFLLLLPRPLPLLWARRRGGEAREVSRTHYRAQAAAHFYGNGWNRCTGRSNQWEMRFVFVFVSKTKFKRKGNGESRIFFFVV